MFICAFCKVQSQPGEKMLIVPTKAVQTMNGPQIVSEAKICAECGQVYLAKLKEVAPGVNPQSSKAALVDV